jgi:hypothetical protein
MKRTALLTLAALLLAALARLDAAENQPVQAVLAAVRAPAIRVETSWMT